jgi:hypothetical protein
MSKQRKPTNQVIKGGKPKLEFILKWYDAWLRCDTIKKVMAALEVSSEKMAYWLKYPELKLAKEMAQQQRGSLGTFSGYIFKTMSPEAREVWKRCQFWENCDNAYEQIERILSGHTKELRQELFLHALVRSNFDISEALRLVALPRNTFENWRFKDLGFRALVEEIQWHKKNFFEHALVDLVEQRHPAAVMFVNRTVNADRGYGEKMEFQHNLNVGVRLEELDLDIDTKRKILEAIRKKNAEKNLKDANPKAYDIDSEAVPVERSLVPVNE